MKEFTIKRVVSGANGTFGVLMEDETPFALTLERQWLDNKSNVSCIPHGRYFCERVNSPKFGDTFEVIAVRSRSNILFHKGNIDDDSHGCILVGEQFGILGGSPAIQASREGFEEFKSLTFGVNEFMLNIFNCF